MNGKQVTLRQRVKGQLYTHGYTFVDLARNMDMHSSAVSMLLGSNMTMSKALLLNDTLKEMTGYSLTLEDFRK